MWILAFAGSEGVIDLSHWAVVGEAGILLGKLFQQE